MIKNDLCFRERGRKRAAQALEAGDPASLDAAGPSGARDPHAELFGRVNPRHIPESASWFHGQQKDLMALSADHELGLPTAMVTLTQNDSSPELLAHARRGPCAVPTEEELYEYLLTRRSPSSRRPDVQEDPVAATLSFERRNYAQKMEFLRRHHRTPLGVCTDTWDRSEEQKRRALHSHTLVWCKRRKLQRGYEPRPAIQKRAEPGEPASSLS